MMIAIIPQTEEIYTTLIENIRTVTIIGDSIRKRGKHRLLYEEIVLHTSFLPTNTKIKERIYVILNKLTIAPSCVCGKLLRFLGPATGYRQFCSVSCAANSMGVQIKKQTTCLKNHGVSSPAKSASIREKMWNTTNQRLGVKHSQQHDSVRNKTKQTNLVKYGTEIFTKSKRFKIKSAITFKIRYNDRMPKQSHISENTWNIINDKTKLAELNQTKNLVEIADNIGVSISLLSRYFKNHKLPLKSHFNNSKPEKELQDFVMSLTQHCYFNDRRIIGPKELDIVLPKHNLAIEFCGLYWHSDVHDRIDQYYHLNKTINCAEAGIQLLTFFEDEWYEKRSIIENMIKHKINKSTKLYARKCAIVDVHPSSKKIFFDNYHIQGNGRGSISYGLKHNNILVACMTFITHKNGIYELNRFASQGSVIGGFSKLLKHFKQQNKWIKIISYADKRFSVGDIYRSNNFILTSDSKPAYSYISQKKRFHRKRFMKHLLHKTLPSYDPTLSERENVEQHNIHRIWDCGQLRFELVK